ncbi:hypothetical protein BJ508DRAFT_363106 [Ascobolus immersus RN42]|uniref:Uncharacterized protein n=1 Tax=Ascobolus immersus RN42 TaxID=1160509 RepID=A0A3N4I0H3_ASCIM|nr:hypothetical protein BJ508DRAFT_363106 [Ascobolus immersus RN42]
MATPITAPLDDNFKEEESLLWIMEEEENEIRLLQQRLAERKAKLLSLKQRRKVSETTAQQATDSAKEDRASSLGVVDHLPSSPSDDGPLKVPRMRAGQPLLLDGQPTACNAEPVVRTPTSKGEPNPLAPEFRPGMLFASALQPPTPLREPRDVLSSKAREDSPAVAAVPVTPQVVESTAFNDFLARPTPDDIQKPSIDWATQMEEHDDEVRVRQALLGEEERPAVGLPTERPTFTQKPMGNYRDGKKGRPMGRDAARGKNDGGPSVQDSSVRRKGRRKRLPKQDPPKQETPIKPRTILKNPNSPTELNKAKTTPEKKASPTENSPNNRSIASTFRGRPNLPNKFDLSSTPEPAANTTPKRLSKNQKLKAKKLARSLRESSEASGFLRVPLLESFRKAATVNDETAANVDVTRRIGTPKGPRRVREEIDSEPHPEVRRGQIDKEHLSRLQFWLRKEPEAVKKSDAEQTENSQKATVIFAVDSTEPEDWLVVDIEEKTNEPEIAASEFREKSYTRPRNNSTELRPAYGPWAQKRTWRSNIRTPQPALTRGANENASASLDPHAKPFALIPTAPSNDHSRSEFRNANLAKQLPSIKFDDHRTRNAISNERFRLRSDLQVFNADLSKVILSLCVTPRPIDEDIDQAAEFGALQCVTESQGYDLAEYEAVHDGLLGVEHPDEGYFEACDIPDLVYEEATWKYKRRAIQAQERLDWLNPDTLNTTQPMLGTRVQILNSKRKQQLSLEAHSLRRTIEAAQADIVRKKSLWIAAKDDLELAKKEREAGLCVDGEDDGAWGREKRDQASRLSRELSWRKEDWIEAARYWSKTLGPMLKGRLEFVESAY